MSRWLRNCRRSVYRKGSATSTAPVRVWSGDDDRLRAEACSALERAGITPHPVSREDHLFAPSEHPRFEVYVAADVAAAAKAVLDAQVLSAEEWDQLEDSGALELPDEDVPEVRSASRRRTDWHPEDATAEIWSGADTDLARMIAASLRENQIDCRIETISPEEADAENAPPDAIAEKSLYSLTTKGEGKRSSAKSSRPAPCNKSHRKLLSPSRPVSREDIGSLACSERILGLYPKRVGLDQHDCRRTIHASLWSRLGCLGTSLPSQHFSISLRLFLRLFSLMYFNPTKSTHTMCSTLLSAC